MEPTENVELETVEAAYWAEQLSALERLEKNPDFKKIILDGYLKEKVLDSVSLLSHPDVKKRGERPDIMEDLVASSNLQYFFFMIKQLGGGARQDLIDVDTADAV
jgi:hypothetical protein